MDDLTALMASPEFATLVRAKRIAALAVLAGLGAAVVAYVYLFRGVLRKLVAKGITDGETWLWTYAAALVVGAALFVPFVFMLAELGGAEGVVVREILGKQVY